MDTQEIRKDKKQNRILKALSRLGAHIYEVFKDYPATMIAIIAAAFLGAILAGDNIIADDYEEEAVRVIGFFLIFSFPAIMCSFRSTGSEDSALCRIIPVSIYCPG